MSLPIHGFVEIHRLRFHVIQQFKNALEMAKGSHDDDGRRHQAVSVRDAHGIVINLGKRLQSLIAGEIVLVLVNPQLLHISPRPQGRAAPRIR